MKITAQGLEKSYKGRRVVNGVNFDISQGEIVGLLGPNGAGKTTTFYMTTGLVKPSKGKVFFDDREVTKWPMFKRARAGVGYLPQEASVFRKLTEGRASRSATTRSASRARRPARSSCPPTRSRSAT